ncbi:MAG: flavin reductase family protein [Fibrobacter sp.]|uniref:flavin reductase family protein n=1 Tax=Fibrobacter sp. TaxID=35828 RepID=UPI0025C68D76|nr:flavin reductase family protein [Fibrobacter sp.]MBQ7081469.1 flavin reductase family protein [Fibrobacter sp.]MBR2057460.1 flavin reductase family protein [Fibrobacter sp.]MBR4007310.1 flavin reductase family protein [Fibrobacter sp.]
MTKRKIKVSDYATDIAHALEHGILVTTKADGKVNSMVVEWGHVGRIWNRPVFVAYIRDSRYTRELLDKNPEFTVNIPVGPFDRRIIAVCGTKSGRDMDKIHELGLSPVEPECISVPGLKEMPLTLECKVIYRQEQDSSMLPEDIRRSFYSREGGDHISFFGEIVAAYVIED